MEGSLSTITSIENASQFNIGSLSIHFGLCGSTWAGEGAVFVERWAILEGRADRILVGADSLIDLVRREI